MQSPPQAVGRASSGQWWVLLRALAKALDMRRPADLTDSWTRRVAKCYAIKRGVHLMHPLADSSFCW